MFEKNTKQVNRMIANLFAGSSIVILIMVALSAVGFFEFGAGYTEVLFTAGLIIAVTPRILIRFCSDTFLKYYMLICAAVFIGILGTNNHIGVYITYALVPILSCLYFDPQLVLETGIFSYFIMETSVYVCSASTYEVVYQGRDRMEIFAAYALGFTIEFIVVITVLYFLVKRARQMMEERYSAEEQNRMKSEFLSSMSHEIRTPMNAIIGMSEVALQKEMSDDLRKSLSIIRNSSVGLLTIINDILDISKIEAGKLNIITGTYKTRSLVDDATEIINARNSGKHLPIYYHVSSQIPSLLEGDVVRIRQVMLNYASNAIKYTEHGRIDITFDFEMENESTGNLIFKVSDTGQGVRQEDIPKLFTMYSQLNQEQNHGKEGTGIGLALCKSFIETMGGTVNVESTYGKGSTFSFSLPQKIVKLSETDTDTSNAFSDVDTFTTQNAHLLLVDDNEINREVVLAMLEPLKIQVTEAADGMEALRKTKETFYDLIFMDSHMPVMNGEETTRAIRGDAQNSNCNTPIIALTADAISGVREKLLECGMTDYISKPVELSVLRDTVRKYLPASKIIS